MCASRRKPVQAPSGIERCIGRFQTNKRSSTTTPVGLPSRLDKPLSVAFSLCSRTYSNKNAENGLNSETSDGTQKLWYCVRCSRLKPSVGTLSTPRLWHLLLLSPPLRLLILLLGLRIALLVRGKATTVLLGSSSVLSLLVPSPCLRLLRLLLRLLRVDPISTPSRAVGVHFSLIRKSKTNLLCFHARYKIRHLRKAPPKLVLIGPVPR